MKLVQHTNFFYQHHEVQQPLDEAVQKVRRLPVSFVDLVETNLNNCAQSSCSLYLLPSLLFLPPPSCLLLWSMRGKMGGGTGLSDEKLTALSEVHAR
jgi:hypothetical protein